MPGPIKTLLLLVLIFLITFSISFVINAVYVFKTKLKNPVDNSPKNQGNKIYYIEKSLVKPQKKRKRKPTIALKGTIITQKEFEKIKEKKD